MLKAIRGRVEATWESILEGPEISLTEVDLKTGQIRLGASWNAMFGRSDQDLVSRAQVRELILPEDLQLFDQDLQAHLEGKSEFVRRDLRVRCADGGFKWASVRVKAIDPDRQGVPTRLVGMIIDVDKRRRAEQLLADMNRFLMSTLSSVTSHILVLTADGSIVLANDSWLRYRGVPRTLGERMSIGGNYFESLKRIEGPHAPLAARMLATAEALLRGENPDNEIDYETIGDSTRAFFLVRLTRFDLPDGPRITVTHRDITGTVEAERTARENEQRWRFAIDGSGDSIWDWDAGRKKIYRSARFFKMLGMDDEDFAEDFDPRLGLLVHEDDKPLVTAKFAALMRGDYDASAFEHRLRHKDGSWRWVMARCTVMRRAPDQRATRILGVHTDITELKNAEAQLRARELENRLLALVAQHTTNAVIITDAEGRIEWVNRGCEAMTGYGLAEACKRAPQELLYGADTDPQCALLLNEKWAAGERLRTKLLLYRKSGAPFWASIEFQPIIDEHQHRRHFVVVMEDVTERERLEAERRLSQKLESVGQLAAGVAHEINTPIQFVGDSITFLDEAWQEIGPFVAAAHEFAGATAAGATAAGAAVAGTNMDHSARTDLAQHCPHNLPFLLKHFPLALGRAQDGVKRVAVIVRAMKEFAYPDRGQLASADINHAVLTTLTVARNEYKYFGIVTTECGELPPVRCSASAVSQVLLNLIVNAAHALEDMKHDPTSGRITVRTSAVDDHVVVSVSDNGCGIPEHIVERIFDPFFTSKDVGRGTGQGLAIARSIVVDQHQGRITVNSKVGQGTTFEVWLPIDGPAAVQDSAEVPQLRSA
ncbi:MAG: PAS domain S-box protein [Steroidobacteraceae bacterium]